MSQLDKLHAALREQPRSLLMAEAIGLVLAIGWVDWATGYEVTFFPFYSIPVLLALWFVGKEAGVAISVLSALAWWCADTASGHSYAREWLRFWDAIVRLVFFCLVVIAGSTFRDQRDANRAKIALLERSRKLEEEIVMVSESEQRRIGRDLHDSLGQQLVAMSLAADSITTELQPISQRASMAVAELAKLLRGALVTARDLARGLSPVRTESGGLISALEDLTETTSRLTGIDCAFLFSGEAPLEEEAETAHLYRIAQEALNNATKHSKARNIIVAFDADVDHIELRISDDGTGFQEKHAATENGMGLAIMRYRARLIGARLDITQNQPNGTVVTCRLEARGNRNSDSVL